MKVKLYSLSFQKECFFSEGVGYESSFVGGMDLFFRVSVTFEYGL